jgi:para-nitrobenzyl esterase
VPVITGTNRDERRLYLYRDPRFARVLASTPGDYVRYAHYSSLAWKLFAVDEVARAMSQAGHRAVYTYRFDWDEQGVIDGVDLSLALGAAHSVEIPFVFGLGTGLATFGDPAAPGRVALTTSVQSYWAEFAYQGAPGSGRDGQEAPWLAWDGARDALKLLVLDTAADGGIRMSSEEITRAALQSAVLHDTGFRDRSLQGELYRELFGKRAFERDFAPLYGASGATAGATSG